MKAPMPLRRRFALLATLLGFLLSTLAAGTVGWLSEDYEYILANEILRGQAEDYGLRLANGLPAQLPRTQRLSGYRIDAPELPARYAAFPPGVREDPARPDLHVGVFDTSAGRLVFVVDLGDIEARERHLRLFVALTIVLGTALSGWLGWLLSGIALRPVRALADGVDALPVQPAPSALAHGVSRDELGRLAQAIDAYQARLVDADAREQAFFADASHELRTPLAVIQGVAEVLLDDPPAHPADLARIQRLERGVREMRQLLEAMLAAARRQPLQAEPVAADELLREAAALALAGKPDVAAQVAAPTDALRLPRREALLLLGGLARRLAQPLERGTLHLRLDESRKFSLWMDPAPPDASDDGPARADTGTGSALLDRLAQRLGWTVAFPAAGRVEIVPPRD